MPRLRMATVHKAYRILHHYSTLKCFSSASSLHGNIIHTLHAYHSTYDAIVIVWIHVCLHTYMHAYLFILDFLFIK